MADAKHIGNGSRKRIGLVVAICVLALSCAVALCVNLGFANARGGNADIFGLGSSTSSTKTSVGALAGSSSASSGTGASSSSSSTSASEDKMLIREDNALTKTTSCDISQNVNIIKQRQEAERLAAEEAERAAEQASIQKALEAQAQAASTSLSPVDFTVGKTAFVAEWGARIDAYLEGSPLAGYGSVFAEAAFDYGVDPRWSPAISNTESGKGTACFKAYNAWGWMGSLGNCWEDSIRAHVAGLANGYGYTISVGAAQSYCPPTYMDWYNKTIGQMALI